MYEKAKEELYKKRVSSTHDVRPPMARQIEVEIEVEKPCRIQVVRHSMHEYVAITIRSTFSCVIAHLVHFY